MTKLETKVAARNAVNVLARRLLPSIRAALAPFVGKKVELAAGGQSAKFHAAVESLALPGTQAENVYVSLGHGYSVTANFRTCLWNDSGTFYGEATLYLYDLVDGVMVQNDAYLSHINTPHYWTDFSADEILKARKKVAEAREALQAAERGLCSFGEND